MFIRNKLGTNNRISVQIVESIRNGKKISQKVLETIGSTDKTDRKRLQSLKSIAEGRLISIKKDRLDSPQFETKKPGRRKKKSINDIKPITNVLLSNITQITQIIDGVDDITEQVYSEFGFEKLFPKSTNSILKKLITFRITSTYRKEKLWQVLLDNFDHNYTINRVLRVLDYIYPKLDKLHQQMLTSFKNLVPQSTALYIKIRRLHFSAINSKPIIELDNHDNFKIKSLDYTIVIVSNEFGLPLDYLILNDSEIKLNNLLPHINEWVKLYIPPTVYFYGLQI